MMLNVKLIHFKIKYLSMKISNSHISKRNKSPTCTFLQVDLNLKNRQTRHIRCLRAYYLGDCFYLECHNMNVITGIRLANSRWYWKSDVQASYSRLIPLIVIPAHGTCSTWQRQRNLRSKVKNVYLEIVANSAYYTMQLKFSNFHNICQSLHIMNRSQVLEYFRQELASERFRKNQTDVTLQFKTHDQNLQVCLKWETKIMLKQLLSYQNKEKYLKKLETIFYRREIKIVKF